MFRRYFLLLSSSFVSVAVALVFIPGEQVFAATSTNYTSSQEEAGPTEGTATSTMFDLYIKVGAPVVGCATTSQYIVTFGAPWDPYSNLCGTTTSTPSPPPTSTPPGGGGGGGPIISNPTPTTTPTTTPPVVPPTSTPSTTPNPTPTSTPTPTTTPPAPTPTSTPPTTPPTTPPVNPPTTPPTAPVPGTGGSSTTPPLRPSSTLPFSTSTPPAPSSTIQPIATSTIVGPTRTPLLGTSTTTLLGRVRGQLPRRLVEVVKTLAENKAVEETARAVIAPSSAGLALAALVAQVPLLNILRLLQLLFLQPLLLIGYGRRVKAGQVYNTLTKLPVDLALVRLVDPTNGRIVQSRVTDKDGFFYFQAPPGHYRLEVSKEGMVFPSKLLLSRVTDGRRASLYHGEEIVVTEQYPLITPNVPLDPVEVVAAPRRLIIEHILRAFQAALSVVGLGVTAFSLILNPNVWYTWVLLGVHTILFFVFRRLAMPPKPKGWGIVYDQSTKKPLGRAVARLFNTEFNKLVASQVTDAKGRYYFLAGDSNFQVRFERKEYEPTVSPPIDLTGKEADTISLNVGLKKGAEPPPAPPTPPAS